MNDRIHFSLEFRKSIDVIYKLNSHHRVVYCLEYHYVLQFL